MAVPCADAAAPSIVLQIPRNARPAAINLDKQNIAYFQQFTIVVSHPASPDVQGLLQDVILSPARAAAIASALLMMTCEASAVSFDERWSSMFGVSQMTSESVSAKAELVRRNEISRKAERRSRAYRQRIRRGREYRHREWYKGGKRWHYVYSRQRARR